MADIIDIFGKFKNEEEKNDFIRAQWATINNLNKQVEQLKDKNRQLEELLKTTTQPIPQLLEENQTPEEIRICNDQLRMLKGISKDRELTLEECRKVEIYSKILNQSTSGNRKAKSPIDGLNTEQLLNLVTDESSKIN